MDDAPTPEPPQRKWWHMPAVIVACAVIAIGFRWLTAAGVGEKCGGATGCDSGLVCVQPSSALSGNVVKDRKCRKRCETDADCKAPRECVQIGSGKTHACVAGSDFQ